jgi:hypothetical protein
VRHVYDAVVLLRDNHLNVGGINRCGRLRIVYMVDNTVDMPVLKRADVAGWLGMTYRENTWPAVYFEPPV